MRQVIMADIVNYNRPELGPQCVVTSENVRSFDCRVILFLFFIRQHHRQQ